MHGFSAPLGLKWGFGEGQNKGRGGAILTPNELVLTFRGSYVCVNFGKNRSRNATVRVLADGQTHRQTQTDFILCPMLYAIAMGQIKNHKLLTEGDQIHLVFKCLHGLAPANLADYCQPTTVTAGRTHLRSANTQQLAIPRTNTGYGDRSFAVSGPSVWNSLPTAL